MRRRDPARLDDILAAATEVFIEVDYRRAKIGDVAARAGVAPGTIYLYFADKEGLFEVAFLRACESPLVASFGLPYRRSRSPSAVAQLENAVEATVNFPQLWVAGQRQNVRNGPEEYSGILLEIAGWIARYRSAILIAHRSRLAKPELQAAFDRLVWQDVEARLAAYIAHRTQARLLPTLGEASALAHLALDSLAGSILGNPIHPVPADPDSASALAPLLLAPFPWPSGDLPLPTNPMK